MPTVLRSGIFLANFANGQFLSAASFYEQVGNEISVSCGRHFIYRTLLLTSNVSAQLHFVAIVYAQLEFSLRYRQDIYTYMYYIYEVSDMLFCMSFGMASMASAVRVFA